MQRDRFPADEAAACRGSTLIAVLTMALMAAVCTPPPAAAQDAAPKIRTIDKAVAKKAVAPGTAKEDTANGVAGDRVRTTSGEPVAEAAPAPTPAAEPAKPAAPPVAAPAPPTPEAGYRARLDELIAPVRDLAPSAEDAQKIKDAIRLNAAGDPAGSRALRAQVADPAARRLLEWLSLKGGYGDPLDYRAFLDAHPQWPERGLLTRRAEEQLFTQGGSSQKIRAYFKGGEPKTGAGWAALASASLAEKDEAKARELASKVWRDFELAGSFETGFLERFGPLLTEADHRRRLDRILVDEVRFSAARNDRAAIARRIVPLLSEAERKKAEARIAVFLRAKNAGPLLAALSAEAEGKTDWGLAYQKVQQYRRNNQNEEAWKILKSAPTDPELITSPDDWWAERRGAAYDLMRAGKADLAYEIVREAGPLTVNPLKDQTFMAGFIALRLLKKTDAAIKHFEASRAAADGPLGRARADYWWGRALQAAGRRDEARARYADAAKEPDTFHGQLGRHMIDGSAPLALPVGLPALPTAEEVSRFSELEPVRAVVIATRLGLDRNIRLGIFGALRNTLKSEGEMAMLAHLASALGDPQTSLRVGKTAIARSMNLAIYAYPLHTFPEYAPLREPPEQAFLLGIARQETEFNNTIVSTAGARGLLQVMPVTAQHVCRDYKLKCDIPRLLTDNAYNAQIASAYIADRMVEFRGNYPLTLAGYNAGPGRARQWIRELGDPREPGVDPIDWIERIPIEETREYVKKVLSNIQVYRARLGEQGPLRLEQDLVRTKGGQRTSLRSE